MPNLRSSFLVTLSVPLILTLSLFADAKETGTDDKAKASDSDGPQLRGRVVLASNPEQGVAGIGVSGHAISFKYYENQWRFHGRTDKDGYFSGPRVSEQSYLTIFDSAQLRGAIQIVEPDQTDIVLSLAPTASIQGTVFDAQNNVAAARHRVEANVIFSEDQNWTNSNLQRKGYTDEKGKFLIEGLVPGFNYQLTSKSPDSEFYVVGPVVGHVNPSSAERIILDDLQIPKTHPTLEEFIASRYLDKDPEERLKYASKVTSLGKVRTLIIAMERDCDAAKQFYQFLYDKSYNRKKVDRELLELKIYEFIPLSLAPSESKEFLEWHGIAIPSMDDGTFAVLDAQSNVLVQKSFAEFCVEEKFDPKLFAAFLDSNVHPPLPNAQGLLDGALAEATRDNKQVFIHVGGPGCGPCYVLANFFDKNKSLISKDYVVLKLDARMPGIDEVYEKLTGGVGRGAPWMTILDAKGETLITGDTEDGNIGYPNSKAGREQFKRMLTTTRQRLTDDEIASLMASLQEIGEKAFKKED